MRILLLFIPLLLTSCQMKEKVTPETNEINIKNQPVDAVDARQSSAKGMDSSALVLASNALQILNEETGSTTDLLFGMEVDQLEDIVSTTLESDFKGRQLNTECGAGPLTMSSWENGLTLVFQENKNSKTWEFAGWFLDGSGSASGELATTSGVRIGSTLTDLEQDYSAEVKQTSLGHEFSTSSGLYGILSGPGKDAKIKSMWSGMSCNFR